ncbi:MAG TPA: DUF4405 domain-containing protein [Anaerolineales bacterium]|nr:DUF4405 domain-containing protein [Anaerolineales bacterium]
MTTKPKKKISPTMWKLIVDIALFLSFIIAYNLRLTGIAIHEWLALAMAAVIVVHLLFSWNWIIATTKRIIAKMNSTTRVNYILNWLLFIDFIIITITGIWISEVAVRAVGLNFGQDRFWGQLHRMSSDWAIYLIGLHLALNWKWVTHNLKNLIWKPLTSPRKTVPARVVGGAE